MVTATQARHITIGLTGPIGSGVTTASKVFESLGFTRVSVAEAIQKELRNGFARRMPLKADSAGNSTFCPANQAGTVCPQNVGSSPTSYIS